MSTILSRNPELTFQNELDLDELVNEAFKMYCKVSLSPYYVFVLIFVGCTDLKIYVPLFLGRKLRWNYKYNGLLLNTWVSDDELFCESGSK